MFLSIWAMQINDPNTVSVLRSQEIILSYFLQYHVMSNPPNWYNAIGVTIILGAGIYSFYKKEN